MTYTYDTAGRRQTAQATGGTQISYGYNNANQVSSITQGTSQVGISYDSNNRRSTLSLPSGISLSYAYDQDSRLQSLSYTASGSSIGALNYSYDSAGRRTGVSGSLAAVNVPLSLGQATYDAANQLVSWDSATASYDANGSITTDISGNQYTWNARNQLASVTGTANLAFGYDAFGRRVSVTNATQPTSYKYDGGNRIAESSSGSAVAWMSGGLDENFLRTDSNGSVVPITDAVGSTLGLANNSGSLVTTYSYDPYGNTTTSGAASGNTTQYAGRENDGSGLYYYRARYYSPQTGRFISQDPSGSAAGLNLYAYAGANPVSFNDPSGLDRSPGKQPAARSPLCWLFGCDNNPPHGNGNNGNAPSPTPPTPPTTTAPSSPSPNAALRCR